MKKVKLGNAEVPVLAIGCMRINRVDKTEADKFIKTALDLGANFFDHADVYGRGTCEEIFAKIVGMKASIRDQFFLQSKCGIRHGVAFDFSKDHILSSVDSILKRLKTDYLDVFLLHRPDALVEPEEVAEAFGLLHQNGKVRSFGVSNHKAMQIQLLQKYVKQPLVVNQIQLSIAHSFMISQGLHNNMADDSAIDRDGSILDFCRLNDMVIQPWSPFQYGMFKGVFLDNPEFPELNKKIDEIAKKYSVSNTTIAMAWLLRHHAKMQPVTGTMNIKRLKDCIKATSITLSREDWYAIYLAAGNTLP